MKNNVHRKITGKNQKETDRRVDIRIKLQENNDTAEKQQRNSDTKHYVNVNMSSIFQILRT